MSSSRPIALGLVLAIAAAMGCGTTAEKRVDTTLTVRNESQFDLEELRVHDGSDFLGAENLLTAPLAPGEEVVVPFTTGQYVTVFRQQVDVGPLIAVTTAEGLDDVDGPGFVLLVFDDGFRLLPP